MSEMERLTSTNKGMSISFSKSNSATFLTNTFHRCSSASDRSSHSGVAPDADAGGLRACTARAADHRTDLRQGLTAWFCRTRPISDRDCDSSIEERRVWEVKRDETALLISVESYTSAQIHPRAAIHYERISRVNAPRSP